MTEHRRPANYPYSYDESCYELALHFLDGEKDVTQQDVKELSQDIQDAVEDFFLIRDHDRSGGTR